MKLSNKKITIEVYVNCLIQNFRNKGLFWLVKGVFRKAIKELLWAMLLPIAISLHLLNFRRVMIRVEHIGHLAAEIDAFIKARKLFLLPNRHYFVLADNAKTANLHLCDYWKKHICLITNKLFCLFLDILTRHYFMVESSKIHVMGFFGTQFVYKINSLWGSRPPLLTINNDDEDFSKVLFEELGLSPDQWFVCVHVREGGFLPHNEFIQSHRNSSIINTFKAMEEIVRRGGRVVRMGDASMKPLPEMFGIIDYAHHRSKSQRADLVLCAKAKFFLGCTSGLSFLSSVFGVPVAQANMIPTSTLGVGCSDISMPKLLFCNTKNRYLKFNEIMDSNISSYFFTNQYVKDQITPHENTEEDILSLVCEMLDNLSKKFSNTEEANTLQNKYLALFKPGHYSFNAGSKISATFLLKHSQLFAKETS